MFSSIMRSLPSVLKLADVPFSPAYHPIFNLFSTTVIVTALFLPANIYRSIIENPALDNILELSYQAIEPTQTWTSSVSFPKVSTPTAWAPPTHSPGYINIIITLYTLATAIGAAIAAGRGTLNRRGRAHDKGNGQDNSRDQSSQGSDTDNLNDQPSGSGSGSGGDPSDPPPAENVTNYQRPALGLVASPEGPPPPPPPGSGLEQDQHERKGLEEDDGLLIPALITLMLEIFKRLSVKLSSLRTSLRATASSKHASNHITVTRKDQSHSLVAYSTPTTNKQGYTVCSEEEYALMRTLVGLPVSEPHCAIVPATKARPSLHSNSLCPPVYEFLGACPAYPKDNSRRELNTSVSDSGIAAEQLGMNYVYPEDHISATCIIAIMVASVLAYSYALALRAGWRAENVWLWWQLLRSPDNTLEHTISLLPTLLLGTFDIVFGPVNRPSPPSPERPPHTRSTDRDAEEQHSLKLQTRAGNSEYDGPDEGYVSHNADRLPHAPRAEPPTEQTCQELDTLLPVSIDKDAEEQDFLALQTRTGNSDSEYDGPSNEGSIPHDADHLHTPRAEPPTEPASQELGTLLSVETLLDRATASPRRTDVDATPELRHSGLMSSIWAKPKSEKVRETQQDTSVTLGEGTNRAKQESIPSTGPSETVASAAATSSLDTDLETEGWSEARPKRRSLRGKRGLKKSSAQRRLEEQYTEEQATEQARQREANYQEWRRSQRTRRSHPQLKQDK